MLNYWERISAATANRHAYITIYHTRGHIASTIFNPLIINADVYDNCLSVHVAKILMGFVRY
ncbi:MAG: hypothetical protein M3270_01010 [Thermoproteota archaeon]|nr:hypothetical protein [Thermoproteota archaeon]